MITGTTSLAYLYSHAEGVERDSSRVDVMECLVSSAPTIELTVHFGD